MMAQSFSCSDLSELYRKQNTRSLKGHGKAESVGENSEYSCADSVGEASAFSGASSIRSTKSDCEHKKRSTLRNTLDSLFPGKTKIKRRDGNTMLKYVSLIQSLQFLLQKISVGRVNLENVQIGNKNKIVIKEDANESIVEALEKLMSEQRIANEQQQQKITNMAQELTDTKRLVAELKEQAIYCQLTLLELHEKGDVAEESMTKLTNLVEDMSIDLTGSAKMAKLVKEIEVGNEANLSFQGEQAISRIMRIYKEHDQRKWLAFKLGITTSHCHVAGIEDDRRSCLAWLKTWIDKNKGTNSTNLGIKLMNIVKEVENDFIGKIVYNKEALSDSSPEDTGGQVSASKPDRMTTDRRNSQAHMALMMEKITLMDKKISSIQNAVCMQPNSTDHFENFEIGGNGTGEKFV